MPHVMDHTEQMRQCIQECLACHAVCLETVQHSLAVGGKQAEAKHIGMLLACAEICQTSANFMLHGSEFHSGSCGLCAKVCSGCAAECETMAAGDQALEECATACRRCAKLCETMSHATT
jgi:hypothetical protein